MCRPCKVVAKEVYCICTFEAPGSHHLEISIVFFEKVLIQCLPLNEMYFRSSHPLENQKRMRLLKLKVLKVCSGMLAHTEEKHGFLGMNADFDKKKRTTHVSTLQAEERLRGTMENRESYAADTVAPIVRESVDRRLCFL